MDVPKPLSFLLPVLEIKNKLVCLEAVRDAVVPKGAAVAVLEGCSAAVVFGAFADTARALCPACYVLPATVSGKKKKVAKA